MTILAASCRKKPSFFVNNLRQSLSSCMLLCYYDLILKINPFFIHTLYFISISILGFGILKAQKPRTEPKPRNIDVFFTSVSAATVSSMSTVEMEVFSNEQLIVMTILMFFGGEVFTSMVGLHLKKIKIPKTWKITSDEKTDPIEKNPDSSLCPPTNFDHIVIISDSSQKNDDSTTNNKNLSLEHGSIRFLALAVSAYLLSVQILGVSCVMIYLTLVSSARNVLKNKGIKSSTFTVFTVVSLFSSCGFIPTNESMIVFKENSGLLLILIPQILLGNTLFPLCLRFFIWVLGKIKAHKSESKYLLQNTGENIGYFHWLPSLHSRALAGTVFAFLLIGFGLFSATEWHSAGLKDLNAYQKAVGGVFESTNARHSGATIVDLSAVAPAVLVLFVVMMYLPPYTSFIPSKGDEEHERKKKKSATQNLIFSPLSYIAIFIIAICITERKSLREDPLNFSVLSITLEVVSAYGNVGFTTGYGCERRIRADPSCVNKWYGFAGKWSDGGKVILIMVMFYGRLKQFSMAGGQALT